ncbi:MAG: ankyrin repeat domain-containing protein [Acidimicrobiales bacterium]
MDIFAAIEAGDSDQVHAIVAGDPSAAAARNEAGLSAVLAALYRHDLDAVRAILAANPPLDLFDAAAVGDSSRLAELLDADPAQVNTHAADGHFPLGLAAYFGRPHAVRVLLERGADVGQVAPNPMQVQALHAAVAGRSTEAVRLLLEAGADPNAVQQGGYTPLMAAEQHGDQTLIDVLVAHGAHASSGNRPTTS